MGLIATADYYSDTTSFEMDLVDGHCGWAYVVNEDTYASTIFDGDVAFDEIIIRDEATFYVDIPFSITSIILEDGHLRFMAIEDISFNNPTISISDDPCAGIYLEKGTVGTEVEYPFAYRFVIRSVNDPPTNRWSFKTLNNGSIEDIELVNPNVLELFHIRAGMIFEQDDNLRDYHFPRGLHGIQQGESWSIRHEPIEKSRSAGYSEYEHSEGEFWNVIIRLRRRDGGKRDIAFFKWLGSEAQRFMPFIFFSSDILKYGRIEDVDAPSINPSSYQTRLRFREVGVEYEKY